MATLRLLAFLFIFGFGYVSLEAMPSRSELLLLPAQNRAVYTHVNRSYQPREGKVIVDRLPLGIDPSSISVIQPMVKRVRYYSLPTQLSEVVRQNIGRMVKVRSNPNYRGELLSGDAQQVLVRKGNDVSIEAVKDVDFTPPTPSRQNRLPMLEIAGISQRRLPLVVSMALGSVRSRIHYTSHWDSKKGSLNLVPFVEVDNQSGKAFRDVRLSVMVGQAKGPRPEPRLRMAKLASFESSVNPMSGFYRIGLPYRVSLPAGVLSQLRIWAPLTFPAKKVYRIKPTRPVFRDRRPVLQPVDMVLIFQNKSKMPLPAGNAKLFSDGRYLADGQIDDTPKGATVELAYGHAVDVRAEKIQSSATYKDHVLMSARYRVKIDNHSSTPVNVELYEQIDRGMRVVKGKVDFDSLSSSEVRFDVAVPAKGSRTVSYTVVR